MASASFETQLEFTLKLSGYEAEWLRQRLQNPDSVPESSIDKAIRSAIFIALGNATETPPLAMPR